jgi:hypothetical protein
MKQENIKALCKAIAPTTPTDPEERGRVAKLLRDYGKKEGPAINAAELARLVDVRLRQRKDRDGLKPEKIVEEIEATLDLVEMCEFMLGARRRQSRETTSAMFESALGKALTDREKQIKERIYAERSYPLDYATGLIRMGVPGDSAAKRLANWWEFFKHGYSMDRFMETNAGAISWEHFKQLPEAELREAFEKEQKADWPNADVLWFRAQNWWSWHQRDVLKKRETAGKASGAARKAKTRRKK